MSGSFLVDTNILVYTYDRSELAKQAKAFEVLDRLISEGAGVLSTQILAEFFWAVTRKLAKPLTVTQAYARLEQYIRSWKVVGISPPIVLESARGTVLYNLPFWDAQVWATAKLNQIPRVLSEDFSHASRIEGVEFVNPFIAALPIEE